jgi:hypothetical protein
MMKPTSQSVPRDGRIWIDPSMPTRSAAPATQPGYSAGEAEKPPMAAILGIGLVALASAVILGKLGAR